MIDKSKPGRAFEDYVAFVQQALIMCEGQNIEVKRRHKVLDTTGASHEIDVYYEFDLAGVRHRVAMECKDWKKGVDLQRVRAFHSLVLDLPSTIGVVISRNGFQSGAKDFLEKKGGLYFDEDGLPTPGDAATAITRAAVLPSSPGPGNYHA